LALPATFLPHEFSAPDPAAHRLARGCQPAGRYVFAGIYLPVSTTQLEPLARQHAIAEAQAQGLAFKPAGVAAPMASVDAMVLEAKRRWAARAMPGEVGFLTASTMSATRTATSASSALAATASRWSARPCTSRA
jgi:hypothetical protein